MTDTRDNVEFLLRLLNSLKPGMPQKAFKFLRVKKKMTVYHQGSPVSGVYVIKSGKVKVMMSAEDKIQRIIHIGVENDFFGYKEVLAGITKYNNTIEALEDVLLFFIPQNVFIDLLDNHPHEALAFSRRLGKDLLEIENNMVGFNCKPINKGIAHTLLWLDKYFKGTRGAPAIIPLNRIEFASVVGTAPETVIRMLAQFKRKKLISVKRGKMSILNRKGLQKLLKVEK